MKSPLLLTGIGLRAPHTAEFLASRPAVPWIEVHAENYFGDGGKPLQQLEQIRRDYPVSLHGVSLSLGSADDLNWQHLHQLKKLCQRIDPCLFSDHLSWSSIDGQYLHDLLPLPFTNEVIDHCVTRIQQVQEFLQRQILIENISSYIEFPESTMSEAEFIRTIATRAGCGILLDINNIYVSATNLGFSATDYLAAIPANLVQELHLAGFSKIMLGEKEVLIDTHNQPVAEEVWQLYRAALKKLGTKPVMIEWDTDLPSLDTLIVEAHRAEQILREEYAAIKLAG